MEHLQKPPHKSNLSEFLESLTISEDISPLMTMAQVRQIESKPLTALLDRSGAKPSRVPCYTYLTALCTQLVGFYGETWNDGQMKDAVIMLYENYYYIRGVDWVLFAKKAKSGQFGKVYGKFSPAILMEWAERFSREWNQESINLSISGSESMKTIQGNVISSREVLKALNGVKIGNQ